MTIGFIGAGKVGFSLGQFFAHGGLPMTGYYSRHRDSAQEAAERTGTRQFASLEALVRASDAIFLTVPDGAISAVYQELRQFDLTGKQLCHCSGAISAQEAFPGAEALGAELYSIHPLFPVSDKDVAWRELTGAFFCIEGVGTHLSRWAETLAGLGAQVRTLPSEGKARYHAACTVASNLMCALAQVSVDLLGSCGFSRTEALAALAPLMRANLDHILHDGPQAALTGPVERGDAATVAHHLASLPEERSCRLYAAASDLLVDLAQKKHPETDYQPVKTVLEEGSST